jgi:hypothetical protein
LEKNNVYNEEMKSAIETVQAALRTAKPSGAVIKNALEAVKAIGYGIVSSAAWQALMAHPPF